MSKKKKEKTPVVLSNQELIPSVLGVIDEKEKGNIFPIILFIVLIVFIVALPTITSYLSGEKQMPLLQLLIMEIKDQMILRK